jgi:hypothetical protein
MVSPEGGGCCHLPPSMAGPPVFIYHDTDDGRSKDYVAGVLRDASPALSADPSKRWEVYHYRGAPSTSGTLLHAKVLLLRFGPGGGGGGGFLRVVVGSAGLYKQWGHARGACACRVHVCMHVCVYVLCVCFYPTCRSAGRSADRSTKCNRPHMAWT